MNTNYSPIGDYIRLVDERNTNSQASTLLGVSINKYFMPSVANVIGTDLTKYKVIRKHQFACSLMQVSRDEKIPIDCLTDYEIAMVSPAYYVFEVIDTDKLMPEYLSMWFKRSEFDREASFLGVGGVRGSMTWDDFCGMKFPVPPLDKQKSVVKAYQAITDRIALKRAINDNLEATAQALFNEMFHKSDEWNTGTLVDLMDFKNGKSRPDTSGDIPVYGGNGVLSRVDCSNAENVVVIGRVGAYCGSLYLETGVCWVSDNAIYAKSKHCDYEYFDYYLLRSLALSDHHIGTGQPLLTQGILNGVESPIPNVDAIHLFNECAKPLFDTITENSNEAKALETTQGVFLSNLTR